LNGAIATETPSRFVIQSSNIDAVASAAVPLAMAINELCTNAVKYYRDRMGELRSPLRPTRCKISFA
jgi:two-component sensor histidine kinase